MIIITRDYVKAIVALAWVNRFIALARRLASSSRVIGRRFSLLERFVQIKVFMDCDPATLFAKRATRKLWSLTPGSEEVLTYHDVQSDVDRMIL